MKRVIIPVVLLFAAACLAQDAPRVRDKAAPPAEADAAEVQQLRATVVALRARVKALEAKLAALGVSPDPAPAGGRPKPTAAAKAPGVVVFVLDASGSGINHWAQRRDEVLRAVNGFPENQRFNVIAAGDKVTALVPRPAPATDAMKARAIKFLSGVKPSGISDMGEALQVAGGHRPTTVWLVTDGDDFMDNAKVLETARTLHGKGKATVNVVVPSAGKFDSETARDVCVRIAADTQGRCIDLRGKLVADPRPAAARGDLPVPPPQNLTGPSVFD